MAITHERFEQGLTVEQYIAQMTQNRDTFERNQAQAALRPEDVAFFERLPQSINTLIITEDWCGDALANVPVLAALAERTGKLNLRLFLRDQNLDLADQYLKEGKYRSVPVFVFFDQQMRELGHFIERPADATAEMRAATERLAAEHPELPDLTASFDTLSDEARRLRAQSLRELRASRSAAWTAMLLDDIERLLSAQPIA
ncbi:MAG TPA: thioredoxin family protein [Ktedonobacterales bacterium]|nr:thioredoxin family protein [Ktedonobacterales bacterium]HEX5571851.1 thioredoxin family protein [Ktedonobacterales bacterium]